MTIAYLLKIVFDSFNELEEYITSYNGKFMHELEELFEVKLLRSQIQVDDNEKIYGIIYFIQIENSHGFIESDLSTVIRLIESSNCKGKVNILRVPYDVEIDIANKLERL